MVIISIKMNLSPENSAELLQTVKDLNSLTRNKKGCVSCHFYKDVENENLFSLVEEWETKEDRDNYLKSGHFSVLRGAMSLLEEPPDITYSRAYKRKS
jgi:quinol monooxygenase YgiN